MNRIILVSVLLFATACHNANPGYVETDKIQLLFYSDGRLDDKEKVIDHPTLVPLSIHMDIEKVTHVEFSDVSPDEICNYSQALPSPSKMASFTFDPKANIKKIDFRIRLPCAAYDEGFYYLIKVKSLEGNYVMRRKFLGKVIWNAGSGA